MDPVRPRCGISALGGLDPPDDLGLGVQQTLRDGEDKCRIGQRQVGRQERHHRRVGPTSPAAPAGQEQDDQEDGRPLDQRESEVVEGARGVERAEGRT